MSWMPIETAPKDGRVFMAIGGRFNIPIHGRWDLALNVFRFSAIAELHGDCANVPGNEHPTHWQPLPEPPES